METISNPMQPLPSFDPDDELRCRRCAQLRPTDQLDRQLWCEECVAAARNFAARWGRVFGLAAAAALAIWVALAIAPAGPLLAAWAAIVVVAYRILGRLGRELVLGGIRAGLIHMGGPGRGSAGTA